MANWLTRGYWSAFTAWHARDEGRLPFWDLERVRAIQTRRVRRMAAHAYQHTDFYREAMRRAGMEPGDVRDADDLARLPIVTKDAFLADPERFRAANVPGDRCLRIESGGTSGRPKSIYHEPASIFIALARNQRERVVLRHFTGRSVGYREVTLARPNWVGRQIRRFIEANSWRPPAVDLIRLTPPVLNVTLEEQVEAINEFRPTVIRGYGGMVGSFFRRVAARGLRLELPRAVSYGAERMPDAERDIIENHFGVPVVSVYRAVEALHIGFQCPERKGFHLFLDDVAVRVVDDEGNDVGPGDRGHLLVSSLTNRATVLLNYKLGDVVRVGTGGACPCGRRLPIIEAIEGRSDDMVRLPSGDEIHALAILEVLRTAQGTVQLQLVQETPHQYVIRAVSRPDGDRAAAGRQLHAALNSALGFAAALEIEWVDEIPKASSGKVKAVISHCRGDVDSGGDAGAGVLR